MQTVTDQDSSQGEVSQLECTALQTTSLQLPHGTQGQAILIPQFDPMGAQQGCIPWANVHGVKNRWSAVQSVPEDVDEDAEGRRPKRRSSNAGVQYSDDLSDAMFNRLLQPDDQPGSASEVTTPYALLSLRRSQATAQL